MASILVQVADAVVAELKVGVDAGDFVLTFTPERSYADWDMDIADEDAKQILVDVVPVSRERVVDIDNRRDAVEQVIQIDVGVRKKFTAAECEAGRVNRDDMDALVELVQQIGNRTVLERLATFTDAVFDPENPPVVLDYSRFHLREMDMFFGFVRLTYRVSQTL